MTLGRFLSRLFRSADTATGTASAKPAAPHFPPRRSGPRDSTLSNGVLSISSLRFVGGAERSPNKRWVVGAMDRAPGSNPRRGGLDGSAVLLDYPEDKVVAVIRGLSRPMDCAVSDVGTFVVNDANWGEALSADVRVFALDGRELFGRKYAANAYNLDISKCGRYVVVQTCNSRNEDGNLLEVLDAAAQEVMFSAPPTTGWADAYAFTLNEDGSLKHLIVAHKDIGRFRYSSGGEFIDGEDYRKASLHQGGPEHRIYGAKAALSEAGEDLQRIAEVLDAVTRALKELTNDTGGYRAIGLRIQGEALEALGQNSGAVAAYEAALALNPKVGVAKRIARLKKAVPATP